MKVGIVHTAFFGDLVQLGLLIEGLYLSGHEVFLISNRRALLLFNTDFRIKKIVLINKGRGIGKIGKIFSNVGIINALNLDFLLVPHLSAQSSLMSYFCNCPVKIGFSTASFGFLFTEVVPWNLDVHECVRYLALGTKSLIVSEVSAALLANPLPFLRSKNNLTEFRKFFADFDELKRVYFILSPGSVWATKIYPPDLMLKCVEMILKYSPKMICIVSGGPEDYAVISQFMNLVSALERGTRERILDASRCLPVGELLELMRNAKFSLSADSGPFHMAIGVQAPALGIYGPTSSVSGMGPIGINAAAVSLADQDGKLLSCQPCGAHGAKACPLQHHKCMRLLDPAIVFAAVKRLVPNCFV